MSLALKLGTTQPSPASLLLVAVVISGTGLAIALQNSFRWIPAVGGAILGTGIAAMHFTGMSALEVPARLNWSPGLVISAITFGVVLGSAAFFVAARNDFRGSLIAALLLALAIVSLHFTAMGAIEIIPDPTRLLMLFSIWSGISCTRNRQELHQAFWACSYCGGPIANERTGCMSKGSCWIQLCKTCHMAFACSMRTGASSCSTSVTEN